MHQPIRLHLRTVMIVVILMATLLASWNAVAAQTASPVASPEVVACDVEPRTREDLVQLSQSAATPAGDEYDESLVGTLWDEGAAADDQTQAAIESALALIETCTESGSVAQLIALYTDDYVVREVLATEPVQIVPGAPEAAPSTGTPEVASPERIVREVRTLSDGRVAAQVERDGRAEIVVFAEVDGLWLADAIVTDIGAGGTPEAGVSEELASLPPVQAAVAGAADAAGVSVGAVTITAVEPTEWPDSSLGCPQPGQFYAQVVTPGFIVSLEVAGTEVTYHTDEGEAAVPCEAGGS